MPATLTAPAPAVKSPEEIAAHIIHGPQPPDWARNAFILTTRYLKMHLERNTEITAEEGFSGASMAAGGRIIELAYRGSLSNEPMPSIRDEKPVSTLNPLAMVMLLSGEGKYRVKDLATHFNVTPDEITAAIKEKDSGMKVAQAGWVKLSGVD